MFWEQRMFWELNEAPECDPWEILYLKCKKFNKKCWQISLSEWQAPEKWKYGLHLWSVKDVVGEFNSTLNRPFRSQTDLFGTKILTPQFFLENLLALCQKVGGSENFLPLDPLGPQNPYLGVRPPKTEKLPILQGIFF